MLDFFEHGEREVVETVCLVIFPLISLMEDQVSSLNEKGVKAIVLGPESSDREIKDAFEGKYNLVFIKSVCFQVGFEQLPGLKKTKVVMYSITSKFNSNF